MSIAALVRQMVEAGATPQVILLAVEAMEAQERALADKRAQAASRKRAQRDRERDSHVTVTGQSQDSPDAPLSPAPSFPPDPQTNPTPIPVESYTPAHEGNPFPRPEWAEKQVWADFLKNRRKKKLSNTVTAYAGFLADIARWQCPEWPPPKLLEFAVRKGWGGIYNPREERGNGKANRGGNGYGPAPDPTLAMVRSAIAAQREDGGDYREARPALPPG